MSLPGVRAWLAALRADSASALALAAEVGLSREGLALVLADALDALDGLDATNVGRALAPDPGPWRTAVFVAARTVPTAALEWLAVLLARGGAVTWKVPEGAPGLAPWAVAHARALGLPLDLTSDRAIVGRVDFVVAMGTDESIAAIRAAARPGAHVLGYGSRWSAAWIGADAADADLAGLARDLAAFDGRGCMSPALVLTPDPDALAIRLEPHLTRAEQAWPRGPLSVAEAVGLRTREALVRMVGRVRPGAGWSIHVVPAAHAEPRSRPRVAQLVAAPDDATARARLDGLAREVGEPLSTIGTTGPLGAWPGIPRVVRPGWMQRPPVDRDHDHA